MIATNYIFQAYSHCNYVEILANYGIVGFLLYYVPIIRLIYRYVVNIKNRTDDLHIVFCIILLMVLMIDYGAVEYYGLDCWFKIIGAYSFLEYQLNNHLNKEPKCKNEKLETKPL